MSSTDLFKQAIQKHVDEFAAKDPEFAKKVANPEKNIDDCVNYIINEVKKRKVVAISGQEVFGIANHYYDEEKVDVGKPQKVNIVVDKDALPAGVDLDQHKKLDAKKLTKEKSKENIQGDDFSKVKKLKSKSSKVEDVQQISLF